jgi:hypothetical protein
LIVHYAFYRSGGLRFHARTGASKNSGGIGSRIHLDKSISRVGFLEDSNKPLFQQFPSDGLRSRQVHRSHGISLWGLAGRIPLLRDNGLLAIPFWAVMILYPLPYSMTHIEARYRHPIEPILYLMAAYAICRAVAVFAPSTYSKETQTRSSSPPSVRDGGAI